MTDGNRQYLLEGLKRELEFLINNAYNHHGVLLTSEVRVDPKTGEQHIVTGARDAKWYMREKERQRQAAAEHAQQVERRMPELFTASTPEQTADWQATKRQIERGE